MYDNRCPRYDFPSRCIVDGPTDPYHFGRRFAYDDSVQYNHGLIDSLFIQIRSSST
jgi:hypothetical protein